MAGTFEDELVQMHDEEFSLPSVQVALERHFALISGATMEERQRLATLFKAERNDTILSQDILNLLLHPKTNGST